MLPTRRSAFLGLLLLVLLAPIGWVAASGPTQSYVVLFRDEAVTVPDETVALTNTCLAALLAPGARSRATVPTATSSDSDGVAHRRVDPGRVSSHVRDLTTRNGIGDVQDVYSAAVGGFSARMSPAQSAGVAADPSVAAVIPDEELSLDDVTAGLRGGIRTTSNPSVQVQPGVRRIGGRSSTVAALTAGGVRVNADVAILDTGIDGDHPDLNVVGGYNCTGRNRDKWDDDEGHGTHVAGIVGALDNRFGVTGVAPGVRLWSVKVLDRTGHGRVSWLVCGVDWVTAQRDKANAARPLIEVANMSLAFSMPGGEDSNCGRANNDTLHQAICRSVERGTVYVAAAGNTSSNVRRVRPAAYDEVITVSAMADYDGRGGGRGYAGESCPYWSPEPDDAFASFSTYGAGVDLIAPGKCILSTYLRGRYAWMSGTSMATPHVAGAAVIYRTLFPKATPVQVRLALEASGTLDWETRSDPDNDHEKAVNISQLRTVPDFAFTTSLTSGVVPPGSKLAVGVTVLRVGGFTAPLTLSLLNQPAGISAAAVVANGDSATIKVRVADATRFGRYYLTVSAVSDGVVHTQPITILVRGAAPQASFASPASDLALKSGVSVAVSWTERAGGAAIVEQTLERQSGRMKTPGTCTAVTYTTESSAAVATPRTDRVRAGYCYRWVLTLTDSAGLSSTVHSGDVRVD
jgi:subtilisin family serine protease